MNALLISQLRGFKVSPALPAPLRPSHKVRTPPLHIPAWVRAYLNPPTPTSPPLCSTRIPALLQSSLSAASRASPPFPNPPRRIHAQSSASSVAMQNNHHKEHLYKILVIGDLGVGKTSIIKRYVHHNFSPNYRATIGVDFALKVLNWDQETVRLQLWDIAGTVQLLRTAQRKGWLRNYEQCGFLKQNKTVNESRHHICLSHIFSSTFSTRAFYAWPLMWCGARESTSVKDTFMF